VPAPSHPTHYSGRPPDTFEPSTSGPALIGIHLDLMSLSYQEKRKKLLRLQAELEGKPVSALIDCGAQGCFISESFAKILRSERSPLRTSVRIRTVTGEILSCMEELPCLTLTTPGHTSHIDCTIGPLTHDLILGMTWLYDHNPLINWRTQEISWTGWNVARPASTPRTPNYETVCAKSFKKILQKELAECFVLLINEVTSDIDPNPIEALNLDLVKEYPEVFPENLPSRLPPPRSVDHRIDLIPDAKPYARTPYRLSKFETEEMQKIVEELLGQGLIRPSTSPWAAPVLFAPKKDGKLRFCVDYRVLNKQTVRNYFPIPRTEDLIDKTQGARVFSLIDLWSAYHQVLVYPKDVPKTAFITPFGHFEYLVVPFGLTNAPATFQTLMNSLLGHLHFVSVYLDDILIFSKSRSEHEDHLRQVLNILRENKLHAKISKCSFFQESVEFLGHILSTHGLQPSPIKIDAIRSWPTPHNVKTLQQFLGFANYYRRFIPGFAMTAVPLNRLLTKDADFKWGKECQEAFKALRRHLTESPVLRLHDPELPTRIETDSSGFAIGAVLSQKHKDGWHPVAYLSRSMTDHERNYAVQEQELLALIYALTKWRHYLFGMEIVAYTDHSSLVTWETNRELSGRRARWMELLSQFPVKIVYRAGQKNILADALSRRNDLKELSLVSLNSDIVHRIRHAYLDDKFFGPIYEYFSDSKEDVPPPEVVSVISWFCIDPKSRLLFYVKNEGETRTCVPRNKTLLTDLFHEIHNAPFSAHTGPEKAYAQVRNLLYWPRMKKDIETYVRSCDSCQRNKPFRQVAKAPIQLLPVPSKPWEIISMDFITNLPKSSGYDSILVVVCYLTKMAHFIATKTTATAVDVAQTFIDQVFRLHGIPKSIVSDRDPKFTSAFWKSVFKTLKTSLRFSTADHPETDGQTERLNQTLEIMLRHYVETSPNSWSKILPMAEFAYNSSVHNSTGKSPFFLVYGTTPLNPLTMTLDLLAPHMPQASTSMMESLQNSWKDAQDYLSYAQAQYASDANRTRTFREFGRDDLVLLKRRPGTKFSKFDPLWSGPFRILEKTSAVTYRLQLPETIRRHPVVYVGLLKPYIAANPDNPQIPDVILPEEPDLSVPVSQFQVPDKILDKKITRSQAYYLVSWKDLPFHEASWEPGSELMLQFPALVQSYEETH